MRRIPADASFADASEPHLPSGPTKAEGYPLIGAGEAFEVLHRLSAKHPRTTARVPTRIRLRKARSGRTADCNGCPPGG